MRIVSIPGTSLRPSAICLGTALIGSAIDPQTSFQLLDVYLDRGGNFLDTAKVYADWMPGERSTSEKTIGRWLRQRRNRHTVIVATKGAHPDLAAAHIPRLSQADIVGDLDQSLINLQTDTIDLYWLHRDDPTRPVNDIIDTLADQVTAGKIRYFGCSNWRTDRIRAAQTYAKQRGITGFFADQMMWSLAVPAALSDPTIVAMDDSLRQYHQQTSLAAIPYSSQAHGWFQRKDLGQTPPNSPYANPINEQRYTRVKQLAAETGLSITAIVLGYLTSQPFPVIPIVGCRTFDQLNDTLAGSDVTLAPEQLRTLES